MEPLPAQNTSSRRGPNLRVLACALWLFFAVLVVAGSWLFLRACGLDALGLNYCPAPAGSGSFRAEAAIGDDLARQVHMAQLAVAEAPVCAPPPVAPARRAETQAIDDKVVARGGSNGVLQFTLSWATLDDLDLNVDCPGGRIDSQPGHGGPGICGDGRKDVDANRNLTDNVSTSPIENVVWQANIPQGTYNVEVIEYRSTTTAGNTVPFTLRMRWNEQERICHDVVTTVPSTSQATENGRFIGGSARSLTVDLSQGLPECAFTVGTTYRGAASK